MSAVVKSEYALMPTQTLLDELERLKGRVRDRDDKMLKRLKNPMGHAHPCQFWPLCQDAYKIGGLSSYTYFRFEDWVFIAFTTAAAPLPLYAYYKHQNPHGFEFTRVRARLPVAFGLGTLLSWMKCNNNVMSRMWGLDENGPEIELYGPLYPQEIEEAQQRKYKYEQEYIRIKEGLSDWSRMVDKLDIPGTLWNQGPKEGTSGYWAHKEAVDRMALEANAKAQAARNA